MAKTLPLEESLKHLIVNTCKTAQLLGIIDISIENIPDAIRVRGFSQTFGSPVVINHEVATKLPFRALAINDCKQFLAKLHLAESQDTMHDSILTIDPNTDFVNNIEFKKSPSSKGNKFNLKFNIGNPESVKAPKSIKDTVCFEFAITPDLSKIMNQSIKAMGSNDITLVFDGTELLYEIKTQTKDIFRSSISEIDKKNSNPFVYTYPFSALNPLIQHNTDDNSIFKITNRGLITCKVHDITTYILPRM